MPRRAYLLPLALATACHAAPPSATPTPPTGDARNRVGVLVMAHGGGPEWNEAVAQALQPVRQAAPTAVAFGMADASAIASATDSLTELGVDRVAVVRLFLSGRSFLGETRALLGLGPPPARPDGRPVRPIDHDLTVATHTEGLLESPHTSEIVLHRALATAGPARLESLLLVAHGMGEEEDNDAVLGAMNEAAELLRQAGFERVELATLREDWPEKRAEAEAQMRRFVAGEASAGRTVLVVPVRLFGFGPYADVLQGLDYRATPALLPHPAVSAWVLETANAIACREGWGALSTPCPVE
jgi:sirohydrochlorin cobaltochelatase